MTHAWWLPLAVSSLLATALLPACSSENEDCAVARDEVNLSPTKKLGEACTTIFYGSCPDALTDCAEGECRPLSNRSGRVCTTTCTRTEDCFGSTFCVDGSCQPAAECRPFCDGTLCCQYERDPDDPTACRQVPGSCS